MSDDTTPKLPEKSVYLSLLNMSLQTQSQVQSLNGEVGGHIKTQQDLHSDFTPHGYNPAKRIYRVFKTQSELKARDIMRSIRANLDLLEVILNEEGHGADFADMARNAANPPQGSQPKEEAPDPSADNVVRLQNGIRPLEEKAPKGKGKGKDKTFADEQREENAKGDALIQENLAASGEGERLPDPDEGTDHPGQFSVKY